MTHTTGLAEGVALIVVVAAVLSFIAKKTNQPTIIAYIATGLILGPVGIGMIGETEFTKLFSELGLVFLLFLIGLEINLKEVKEVLKPTVIIGISQMVLTALLGFGTGYLLGFSIVEAAFIGIAMMFSSTALVVKLLTDKEEGSSLPQRLDVGILLIQDVAVVLILALITTNFSSPSQIAIRALEIFAMIAIISGISIASSRYFLPKLFKEISSNRHAFFIHGVAWAFLFISAAEKLNISPEIGAFFAGLSLAQLPYSRELQERVRPLTDLFMAVFFINFALQIVPSQLSAYMTEAFIASAVIMIGKFLILFGLIDRSKFTPETSFKASINMTQISEFSLIFGALAASQGIIGQNLLGFFSLVAITTMGVSSYLITYNHKISQWFNPLLEKFKSEEKSDLDVNFLEDHVVVIGYDTITRNALPILEEYFDQIVVVDRNAENVDELANSSYEFIYGDFRHSDIREGARIREAKMVISVVPEIDVNREILQAVNPEEQTIFVKSDTRDQAAELYDQGAHYVIIRNVLTGEKMADYIKLFLEDKDLFKQEIQSDIDKIVYGDRE